MAQVCSPEPRARGEQLKLEACQTEQRVPGKPGLQSGEPVLKQNNNKKYKECVFYDHMRFDIQIQSTTVI